MKSVVITKLSTAQRNHDLIVDIGFRVPPLKVLYQQVKAELYFDRKLLKSFNMRIPHFFARKDEIQIQPVLNLEKVTSGTHKIKLVMTHTAPRAGQPDSKETTIYYDSDIEVLITDGIPTVKSIEKVSAVEIVTNDAKRLYEEMRKRSRSELIERKDRW